MNPRYQGPAVFPPAPEVRKRIEEHLEVLPAWAQKPEAPPSRAPTKGPAKPRKPRRRP